MWIWGALRQPGREQKSELPLCNKIQVPKSEHLHPLYSCSWKVTLGSVSPLPRLLWQSCSGTWRQSLSVWSHPHEMLATVQDTRPWADSGDPCFHLHSISSLETWRISCFSPSWVRDTPECSPPHFPAPGVTALLLGSWPGWGAYTAPRQHAKGDLQTGF